MRLVWATLARAAVVVLLATTAIATFVEVAGREWTVTAGGPAGGLSLLPWLVALGGLATALLVNLVLRGALRRERFALAKVREKIVERDRAEVRFRDAFATSPIGMAMVDLEGRFVKVNRAFCQITGYHSEALLHAAVLSITHPDDVPAQREAVAATLGGKTSAVSSEMRYLHAGGRSVWVSVNTSLVRDGQGEPVELLQQIQDITERRRFEHKLQHMADHDSLTGLLNRRRFEEELDRHLAGVGRFGPRGAILMLDLDNFKDVNDSLGHHAGDELIATVAGRLQSVLRETDVVARLGGDEFAVLLPGARAAEAEKVAGKLLDDLRGATVELSGQRRRVSASLGIALIRGTGESADELMVNADMALYDAKGAGRDRVTVFADESQRRARMEARASWVERLEHALEHDGFALYAQPIVDLRTGAAVHHELLLRMRAEDGDLIPPAAFLHIAERYGLIGEVDRWVVGRAIDLVDEHAHAGRALSFEVNLSGLSLADPLLLELIEDRVRETEIDPASLIFEVSESAAVSNVMVARDFARRISELGCRFALDDFGAGYGSFSYLKHLPCDLVKIDGEFIRGCETNLTDQLVVKAVVEIARGLGKRTVAELVEQGSTLQRLRSWGVDYAQGYHLGAPAPVESLLGVEVLA